jgi:hypothetical protein
VTSRRLAIAAAPFAIALAATGCGVTRLQTARTVPDGETRTTIAASLVHLGDRGFAPEGLPAPAVPLELMVRHGVGPRVDWGIRNFFGLGVLGDVKWNLLSPERPTALSVSGGFGAAFDSGAVLHVPLVLTASHAVRPWLTPYAAVGYGTYWIIGYGEPRAEVDYAPRRGTGDGLLMLHAGIELGRASGRALLLEYSVGLPIVNDPGDSYGFATNQFISLAFHGGGDKDR